MSLQDDLKEVLERLQRTTSADTTTRISAVETAALELLSLVIRLAGEIETLQAPST